MPAKKKMQQMKQNIKTKRPTKIAPQKLADRLKTAQSAKRGSARAQAAMNRLKKRGK